MSNAPGTANHDIDPIETREWLDAVEDVIDRDGGERVHYLLDHSVAAARARGANLPFSATTAYLQHDPNRSTGAPSRRSGDGVADPDQ